MTDDKWGDLLFMVQEKFTLDERTKEPIYEQDEAEQPIKRGSKEIVIFETPDGRVKLERSSRPLIIDKKYHYHKGSSGRAQVEYTYSETEQTHSLEAFREVAGEWEPIETALPFSS